MKIRRRNLRNSGRDLLLHPPPLSEDCPSREISRGDFNRKPRPHLFLRVQRIPLAILFYSKNPPGATTNSQYLSLRCQNCAASRESFNTETRTLNVLCSMFNLTFALPVILFNRSFYGSYNFTFNLIASLFLYPKKLYLSLQKIFVSRYIIAHLPHYFSSVENGQSSDFHEIFNGVFLSLPAFFQAVESDRLSLLRGIPLFVKEESSLFLSLSFFFLVRNNRLFLSAVKILIRRELREKRKSVNGGTSRRPRHSGAEHNGDFSLKHSSRSLPTASGINWSRFCPFRLAIELNG